MLMSKKTEGAESRYEIGRIVGVHGVRGDMLVLPLTDFPERFIGMEKLDIALPGKALRSWTVRRLEPYKGKNTFFLHLQGIESREAAEAMKDAVITVTADERVELEEGEYWLDDIIGITVCSETGQKLGTVTDILFTGSNDVYLVKTEDGKTQPVPALGDVIEAVDLTARTMTVKIPEGLWD